MPLVGLGVLILWLGWFGFNPGSTLGALGGRFAEVALITNLAAAAGVLGAVVDDLRCSARRSTSAWPATARSPAWSAITAPSGYVEFWAAPIIGAVAGVIVVVGVLAIDKRARRPGRRAVGARPRRDLGHARVRDLHLRRGWRSYNAVGDPAAGSGTRGSFDQLGAQALGVRGRVRVRVRRLLRDVLR